ncbi:SE1561 family protein [Lysinibacillus sp. BF-4]|uniref:SE1561 family protein n=1 Tax=Lysinibacillus sp. BF-4 TaxID=1473546 RepID=UPI000A646CD7|nr:SE1561 family protein [Lysinibacillus sp. BF-4]
MSETTKVNYLKERLENFLDILDGMDPETTQVEDIDRLISMMDELEEKIKEA